MTYQEQRAKVIALQRKISVFNHKLENPKLKHFDAEKLNAERYKVVEIWREEITKMRAYPEYSNK